MDLLASVYSDHPGVIWRISPFKSSTTTVKVERRLSEFASLLITCGGNQSNEKFISVQQSGSASKLRLYDAALTDLKEVQEIKLRSEFHSGFVTAMVYLPLNKMFLFGSNSGGIKLAC